MNTAIFFLPELYFFCTVVVIFLYSIIYSLSSILNYINVYTNITYLSVISLLYTFVLFFNNVIISVYNYNELICKNTSSIFICLFLILISMILLIICNTYNKINNIFSLEFIIFILLSLGSFFILIHSMHFILLYIILELQSILISILICINKYNRYAIEASIKYFILGSFSSLILLFGISILYGLTGLLTIDDLNLFLDYFCFTYFNFFVFNYV